MEKKSFIFYTSWKKNIEMMEDDELRRFINNLINYTEGNSVDLPTRVEKMVWNDLVEVLNHNERKRERSAQRSRENGKKGGRPQNNLIGYNETQQVIEKPNGLNNNLENLLMGNGKLLMENGKGLMDNGQGSKVNGNMLFKTSEYREMLNEIFPDIPNWENELNQKGITYFCKKHDCYEADVVNLLNDFVKS